MSTITAKTSHKAATKAKSEPVTQASEHDDVIVKKTFRMAEITKKFPLPGK